MSEDQKQLSPSLKKRILTRRQILRWSIVGCLIALPIGVSVFRKMKFPTGNVIEIKCPFGDGGDGEFSFTPEDLKIPNTIGNITLHWIILDSIGTEKSDVLISFMTNGTEIESTRDRIQLELFDKKGELIIYTADTYMDTRLAAKISGRATLLDAIEDDPAAQATLYLEVPVPLSEINKIVISVFRIS
ncbi:MAG: hypothetical protein LBG58_04595 [Planctomycetaceae bacterium]|jgi:hypothetical protein|nr:hypothetical protein [Planctomycetaceae bacterium]